jgi:hypothetical protein
MADIICHDDPMYQVELTDEGEWYRTTGYYIHSVSESLWSPHIASGTAMTRWGAVRAAKRSIRRHHAHAAKESKNIPPTPYSGRRC